MPSVPVWSIALVLAIFAPLAVRLYAEHLQRGARLRTEALLAKLPKARSAAETMSHDDVKKNGEIPAE